jgi:hypothetical protein
MASSWRVAASGSSSGGKEGPRMDCARALFSFESRQKDEISFNAGDVLEVLSRSGGDWWVLRNASRRVGLGPSNYLETIGPTELISGNEVQQVQNGNEICSKLSRFKTCLSSIPSLLFFVCSRDGCRRKAQSTPRLGKRYRSGDRR